MCRLVAYIGKKIPLENIIVKPKNSLLEQSQEAQEAKLAVNGDGFGIAWYDGLQEPGLFKDVLPAWSDGNLPSICRLVQSGLFIAHVRASTFGMTSRENCHPFSFGNWSFAHNGGIGQFGLIRRDVENLLVDQFYDARRGCTDSELFFLLLLTNGLNCDVKNAVQTSIRQVSELARSNDALNQPIRLTCVFCDGKKIFGFRHASDNKSPTLYVSDSLDHGGRAIASEPLHGTSEKWQEISPNHLLEVSKDDIRQTLVASGEAMLVS
ncbi:MAG: class II glutamine amidotransferase [Hyphomicrobiales bacterium]|nr:class II glutamine amidotransferase [Hyphomicrobiales bacterium]